MNAVKFLRSVLRHINEQARAQKNIGLNWVPIFEIKASVNANTLAKITDEAEGE